MGIICDSDRVRIEQPNVQINDPLQFYDVIVSIASIKDIINGWLIKLSNRFKSNQKSLISDKVLKIGIIGNSNKGKSFLLSKLSKIELPSGTSIKTEGLSIKYPDLKEFINRKIVLLDSAGLETPVLETNNDEKNNMELFKEKSREKIITESFLQNYIFYNSDILIIVVGILTYSEQKLLNIIKMKLKRENLIKKINNSYLYVIHNLITYTTVEQVKSYIKDILLKSSTFQLEEQIIVNTETKSTKGVCYYEKNSDPKIFHLIYANQYSEAGKYYNPYTLKFIENSYEKITDLKGFNVVETIKERFKEISKDIIENLKEEIEFDDSKDLIKLRKPKAFTLKKLFLDELGFSNLRSSGFEPKYNYSKTNNHIIIKIEAPGNCKIESSIQLSGEYIIIKITGDKYKDEDENENPELMSYNFDGREFGHFSLDIRLKQEDFYIKNESPKIEKKDGIFTISYQIEETKLKGGYPLPKKDN